MVKLVQLIRPHDGQAFYVNADLVAEVKEAASEGGQEASIVKFAPEYWVVVQGSVDFVVGKLNA
jgi:hypothetical protein